MGGNGGADAVAPTVDRVETYQETTTVYDIQVERDRCFIVAGAVVHNSVICLDLDGTIWPVESGEIKQPPLHYNCRSYLAPAVDWEGLGLEPPPDGTRAARDLSGVSEEDLERKVSARRRTGDFGDVKQVPTSVRGEQWLKDQPQRVQEKMLGVGKAKLFRDGDISLSDILRRDNSTVPLGELRGE